MEKRLVVFLILSIFIIFTYPYFLGLMGENTKQSPSPEKGVASKEPGVKEMPQQDQDGKTAIPGKENLMTEPKGEPPSVPAEKEKVIETDLYRVVLSSVGGTIKKWELKKYTQKNKKGELQPIELVPASPKTAPLSVIGKEGQGGREIYTFDVSPLHLNAEKPDAAVEMQATDANGKAIKKVVRFHNDRYVVELDLEMEGTGEEALSVGTNFGIQGFGQEMGGSVGAVGLINNEVIRDHYAKVTGTVSHEGTLKWAGLQDKYFIGALIPKEKGSSGTILVRKEGEHEIAVDLKTVSAKGSRSFLLYAGPKELDRLADLGVQLEDSIDFGWFIYGSWLPVRLVAKPLFHFLRFIYQFTHNYGVAIILLTMIVKVAFFPITKKSLVSMKAMAAVQPKINTIRKKYANDKERMNRELMNLYKEEQINPLGGCLPMFVQIPVFIALFNILYNTIELRQAPFMLWIRDLSDKDPYYVLPIIMGISMFFQQYTQPTSMDPTQAKMMLFLPVIYTFFFLNFPSGLVLYWLVNNVLSILQQYMMNREGVAIPKEGTA